MGENMDDNELDTTVRNDLSEQSEQNKTKTKSSSDYTSVLDQDFVSDFSQKILKNKKGYSFKDAVVNFFAGIISPLKQLFKPFISVFNEIFNLIATLFITIKKIVVNIFSGLLTLFNVVFGRIIRVDIDELDNCRAAKLIRKKMILALFMGAFVGLSTSFLIFLSYIFYFKNTNILDYLGSKANTLDEVGVLFLQHPWYFIGIIFFAYLLFFLLVSNLTIAGHSLFERLSRTDFIIEYLYIKSKWSIQIIYTPFIFIVFFCMHYADSFTMTNYLLLLNYVALFLVFLFFMSFCLYLFTVCVDCLYFTLHWDM